VVVSVLGLRGDWSVGPPPRGRVGESGGARCVPTAPLRVKCQPGVTGSGSGSIRPSMRAGGTNLNCWLGPRSQPYCQMLAPGADVVTLYVHALVAVPGDDLVVVVVGGTQVPLLISSRCRRCTA